MKQKNIRELKVGDKVKVKSLAWYNINKDEENKIPIGPTFVSGMSKYCGRVFTIENISYNNHVYLREEHAFTWHIDFFESKDPQLEFDFMKEKK